MMKHEGGISGDFLRSMYLLPQQHLHSHPKIWRFAARSDALEKLTREQKQALLDEYIRFLEKSDEALEG
jgi:hypothetical protein